MSATNKLQHGPSRSNLAIGICVAATLVLTIADLGSKQWALLTLSEERASDPPPVCEPNEDGHIFMQRMGTEPIVLVDGYLELRYAENCGAAFGVMRSAPAFARKLVFGVAATLASIALMLMFVRGRGGALFAWSVPMIVSGAIGNLYDRVRFGYVVDFIRFHLEDGWEWPTFNVADCGITVGVILLVLDGFREGRTEKEQRKKLAADDAAAAKDKRRDEDDEDDEEDEAADRKSDDVAGETEAAKED